MCPRPWDFDFPFDPEAAGLFPDDPLPAEAGRDRFEEAEGFADRWAWLGRELDREPSSECDLPPRFPRPAFAPLALPLAFRLSFLQSPFLDP